ncbi:MAG: transcriptional regulator [Planctomycetes bacterium]|nr:transcriptional regulator [Planctomycetota bacterium]NOG53251.1 helix-turn-helix transcriptional regulator [Planctomycetota bacterium]
MACERIINLFHRRWAVRVLAMMHRYRTSVGGVRFVMLTTDLSVNRESLRDTLDVLIREQGWVAHHAGYGHPLRPEYVLTASGRAIAHWCHEFVLRAQAMPDEQQELLYNKWSIPVIGAVYDVAQAEPEGARFSAIKAHLPGITPRALTTALKDLCQASLVSRSVTPESYPPRSVYGLQAPAIPIAEHVASLKD